MPRRRQYVKVGFRKRMLTSDLCPNRSGIGKLSLQRNYPVRQRRGLDTEPLRNALPHPTPPEDITVDHVERLITRGCGGRGPSEMACQQACVGHVRHAVPLDGRTGESEG